MSQLLHGLTYLAYPCWKLAKECPLVASQQATSLTFLLTDVSGRQVTSLTFLLTDVSGRQAMSLTFLLTDVSGRQATSPTFLLTDVDGTWIFMGTVFTKDPI